MHSCTLIFSWIFRNERSILLYLITKYKSQLEFNFLKFLLKNLQFQPHSWCNCLQHQVSGRVISNTIASGQSILLTQTNLQRFKYTLTCILVHWNTGHKLFYVCITVTHVLVQFQLHPQTHMFIYVTCANSHSAMYTNNDNTLIEAYKAK